MYAAFPFSETAAVIVANAPPGKATRIISKLRRRTDASKKSITSDLKRVDRMKDADIDYLDIPRREKLLEAGRH